MIIKYHLPIKIGITALLSMKTNSSDYFMFFYPRFLSFFLIHCFFLLSFYPSPIAKLFIIKFYWFGKVWTSIRLQSGYWVIWFISYISFFIISFFSIDFPFFIRIPVESVKALLGPITIWKRNIIKRRNCHVRGWYCNNNKMGINKATVRLTSTYYSKNPHC